MKGPVISHVVVHSGLPFGIDVASIIHGAIGILRQLMKGDALHGN